MEPVLLNVKQVAQILGTSESTVRRMEDNGDLKAQGNGQCRFDLSEILMLVRVKANEGARTRSKMTLGGIKAKDLKEIVNLLEDDDNNVAIILEEFDPPILSIAKDYGLQYPHAFASIHIYGKNHGKTWIV